MKNNSVKSLLLTAAMTGLLTVGVPAFASAHNSTAQNNNVNVSQTSVKSGARLLLVDDQQGDKHSCKGKNDCKGHGGCATDGSKPPEVA
jgi:hypothetical protein